MTRKVWIFAFLVLLPFGAWAQPVATTNAAFDTAMAGSVWGAALAYIEPRSLQALTIPQMTIWGLNGLAALDPDMSAQLQGDEILLYGPNQIIAAVPTPPANDAQAWGRVAAKVAAAAYAVSPALQQAGTQGLISSFFDELFNHFDPYSRYEPPLQAAREQLMVTGLAGTGVTFAAEGKFVTIGAIAADSPAANAGLAVGTRVLGVNGRPAYPAETTRLNNAMPGLLGSTVTLRLADPEAGGAVQNVTLTRALIPPQTVISEHSPAPGIAALKITDFNAGTGDQFSAMIATLMATNPPPTGLVIDLRGNRGGVLRQAVLVADSLMAAGPIANASGRDPDADQVFRAEGSDLTGGIRIVVLVDGQTASASEILSGALADDHRAVVIGSTTLGKGLVQTVTSLPDGGELFVTWSRVLAPDGWPLQMLGVMPQVCTSLGEQALVTQVAALANGRNLMTPALAASRAIRAPAPVDTILNVRDHCPAAIGSDLDMNTAAFLLTHPAAYQTALLP
ncbi:MAG TPA: S41 family peptidase [Acidocella sp.]|uniref:S41 family peptidase n=1 Tax=Acidocella sp. TaxID=50710 RepID=UPI002BB974BE|nr:S41 family peptidase [Acidocella sp.]HVE21134.1 S41 family peptidase [Acidocella sp.]